MKLRILVVLVLMLLPVAGIVQPDANAATKQRTETERYLLGTDADVSCDTNVGGTCFELNGNEEMASIKITDDSGQKVGGIFEAQDLSGATLSLLPFCDSGTFEVPERTSSLRIYVTGPVFGTLNCKFAGGTPGAGTAGTVTATYLFKGQGRKPVPFDEERECLEPTPAGVSVAGITDDGSRISLDVMVLLDEVALAEGQQVFAKAAESYAPLGIDLTPTFQEVVFTGTEIHGMLRQAKDMFNGKRPKGSDVVYVLSSKPLTLLGLPVAGGIADCIGGVRYPERAFATGSSADLTVDFGPVSFLNDYPAKVAAHEIGHLMGGHHHYANCVEGIPSELVDQGEPSACTLMFNAADQVSQNFSTLNGLVVRGHAVEFARP